MAALASISHNMAFSWESGDIAPDPDPLTCCPFLCVPCSHLSGLGSTFNTAALFQSGKLLKSSVKSNLMQKVGEKEQEHLGSSCSSVFVSLAYSGTQRPHLCKGVNR